MDFKAIKRLITLMEKSEMSEIEVEEEGFRVKLTKYRPETPATVTPMTPVIPVSAQQPQIQIQPAEEPPPSKASGPLLEKESLETVTSPMVGTFYSSSTPGTPKYVEEGDEVKKGHILCIIEAMKVMNEIESPCDGKIISSLVENAQPVEYGEALYLIKPNP
jgi:acetyl-CoA carboxylase biotin carboxyl carrier protein